MIKVSEPPPGVLPLGPRKGRCPLTLPGALPLDPARDAAPRTPFSFVTQCNFNIIIKLLSKLNYYAIFDCCYMHGAQHGPQTNVIGYYYFNFMGCNFKIRPVYRFICCNYFILLLLDSNRIVYITTILCNINQDPRYKSKLKAHDRDPRQEPKKEVMVEDGDPN